MKDDKKKLMIVGILVFVVFAVGAFQLMGGSGSKPVVQTPSKPKDKIAADVKAPSDDKINPFAKTALPQRDPFKAGQLPSKDGTVLPIPTPIKPDPAPTKPIRTIRNNFRGNEMSQQLPVATGGTQIAPMQVEAPAFGYQLVGVITGPRPAAVFQDSSGSQRLVQAGSSVDGDSRVLSIRDGEVRVQFKDKTLRLKPGGNPSGK